MTTTTATAVAREAAWLSITTDTLPALLTSAGGPWEVVQAFWPGAKFAAKRTGIYVQRRRFQMERFGGVRLMPHYGFALKLVWPVRSTAAGAPEAEQQAFDNAIEMLRQRVNGLPFDKSHGGRFLTAAETPPGTFFEVDYLDPEVTIPQGGWLRAVATYLADDFELIPA